MCDPITAGLMGLQMMNAQAAERAAIAQANQAAERANAQLQQEYAAAQAQTKAEYAETNRQMADEQARDFDEKSDALRAANESLGTMRATETALSDASLGTILFEEAYGNALNYTRLDKTSQNALLALESQKGAAKQNYISRTTLAQNQTTNTLAEVSARKTTAKLQKTSTMLSIGANAYGQHQQLNAIKGIGA